MNKNLKNKLIKNKKELKKIIAENSALKTSELFIIIINLIEYALENEKYSIFHKIKKLFSKDENDYL